MESHVYLDSYVNTILQIYLYTRADHCTDNIVYPKLSLGRVDKQLFSVMLVLLRNVNNVLCAGKSVEVPQHNVRQTHTVKQISRMYTSTPPPITSHPGAHRSVTGMFYIHQNQRFHKPQPSLYF